MICRKLLSYTLLNFSISSSLSYIRTLTMWSLSLLSYWLPSNSHPQNAGCGSSGPCRIFYLPSPVVGYCFSLAVQPPLIRQRYNHPQDTSISLLLATACIIPAVMTDPHAGGCYSWSDLVWCIQFTRLWHNRSILWPQYPPLCLVLEVPCQHHGLLCLLIKPICWLQH